jgi:hypothetical protein
MPRDIREYLASLLTQPDPAAQDFIRNPRPYPGQRGVGPVAPLAPPEGAESRRAPTQGPFRRLPRLSEIRPLLREPPRPPQYGAPRQMVDPNGLFGGAQEAPRVRFSDVALPSFLPQPVPAPPAQGGPQSPFQFQPGAGQPAVQQPRGQDDLDAAWESALGRVRALSAAKPAHTPSLKRPGT